MQKISIIIPVYNGEKFIDRCWHSLEMQTCDKWEAILIDDGSKDNSLSKLKDIQKKFPGKCKILFQANQGQYAARLKGVQNASGDYCMFLDVDDTLKHNAVSNVLNEIEHFESDIVVFEGIRIIGNKEIPIWDNYSCETLRFSDRNKEVFLREVLNGKRFNNLCFKAIRKSICENTIANVDMNLVRVEEDLLMQLSWIDQAKSITYIPQCLYCYYDTVGSVTNSFVSGRYVAAGAVNTALTYYAKKWGMEDCIKKINERYYIEVCESVRQFKLYT